MKQWQQKVFGIVLFIAAIFLILANFEESSYAFSFLFELIQPVIVAGVLAFFLHIPMNGFRNFLQKHAKRPHKERFWNTISLVLTLLSVCIVLAAVCMLMIPALIQSIMDIYNKVQHNLPIWLNQLAAYGIDTAMLEEWLTAAAKADCRRWKLGTNHFLCRSVYRKRCGGWCGWLYSGNLSLDGTAYNRQTAQ